MTDLDKFIELYRSFGIECIVNEDSETGETYIVLSNTNIYSYSAIEEVTKSDKITGYSDFFSIITFTEKGEFLQQGFWE
jgi:hypothetical protein